MLRGLPRWRWPLLGLLACVLALGACARSKPPEKTLLNDSQCMSVADALKTLRKGDELPRVVQVIGQPSRSYRVFAPFGGRYDILEYDTGGTPCAKLVLAAPKKLEIVFDAQGRMVGVGRKAFLMMQRATLVRVNGLPVDIDAFAN